MNGLMMFGIIEHAVELNRLCHIDLAFPRKEKKKIIFFLEVIFVELRDFAQPHSQQISYLAFKSAQILHIFVSSIIYVPV